MFDVWLVILGLFGLGCVTGYGVRELISRRRRTRRVFLPHVAHFRDREDLSKRE
jgi:hypothetical protein